MKTTDKVTPISADGNSNFLSAKEAADFLRIKLPTLYAMVERRSIPFYRIGKRKLLFKHAELLSVITRHSLDSSK